MIKKVNALGLTCPLPVIETKKALEAIEKGTVEVLVDNEIAVQNLSKMADQLKMDHSFTKEEENVYKVEIIKGEGIEKEPAPMFEAISCAPAGKKVVVISDKNMGVGDEALGKVLMKGFIFALTQLDKVPDTILFYNSGAFISIEGSESIEDLKKLEEAGTEILTCGTCLNHYGIAEKLAVGSVTNMYVIAETMMNAGSIVKP